jgi:hypothetical protein
MAKEELIEKDGVITEIMPSQRYRIEFFYLGPALGLQLIQKDS